MLLTIFVTCYVFIDFIHSDGNIDIQVFESDQNPVVFVLFYR